MSNIATAGNKGKGVRSDCFVTLELTKSNGLEIKLESKVKTLYGKSILDDINKVLKFFGIKNAKIYVEDSGALSFIIIARIEAAIRQLMKTEKEYLPPLLKENTTATGRDRSRVSRLYLPGNTPSLMLNAGIHKPDGLILDLEDAVATAKKDEARYLVRNALIHLNFYGAERMVRINQGERGLKDLEFLVPHNVNLILLPKCEEADQLKKMDKKVQELRKKFKVKNPVWFMPIIESAKGVLNAYSIATASENVVAMAIGLEDYTADLGAKRTQEATESFFARSMVVNACRAAGIQPIDSVFSDVSDMEGLKQNVLKSKALGFDGMGCIHPRQIRVLHEYFAPDAIEIEKAKKIVLAFHEATKKGLGVVSLGTKMIDPPVVKRAQKSIDTAVAVGKLTKDWMEIEIDKATETSAKNN
ncbi:MAG: HpcH/HpaI aldolase/citrate lyase family protein [Bacteroidetes bacterium]|nr:HpcH/HpaI aldolase/citrate lyase family protein [Bacteroidota bacterium]